MLRENLPALDYLGSIGANPPAMVSAPTLSRPRLKQVETFSTRASYPEGWFGTMADAELILDSNAPLGAGTKLTPIKRFSNAQELRGSLDAETLVHVKNGYAWVRADGEKSWGPLVPIKL